MEAPKTPAQSYAMIAGAFLAALGVLSLIIASVEFGTVGEQAAGDDFLIWEVSGWTTIAWMATGGLGLLAMSRVDAARTYALGAGIFFAVLAVWGFIDGNDVFGLIAAGTTNNITHAVLAGLGLAVALPPERKQREYGLGREGVQEERPLRAETPRQRTGVGTRG